MKRKHVIDADMIRRVMLGMADGLSYNRIHSANDVSKKVIQKIAAMADRYSLTLGEYSIAMISDSELIAMYHDNRPIEPDWPALYEKLLFTGMTRMELYIEYKREYPNGIGRSSFFAKLREFEKCVQSEVKPYMPLDRVPGEQIEVDWCRRTYQYLDDQGSINEAHIFVGVLCASQYIFTCAAKSDDLPSFLNCHVEMYRHFGGSTKFLICDNSTDACKATNGGYLIATEYAHLAHNFRTKILPQRFRCPNDKSYAENSVRLIQHEMSKYGSLFSCFEAFAARLREETEVVNCKNFWNHKLTRSYAFSVYEKRVLNDLSGRLNYVPVRGRRCTVGPDTYTVSWCKHEYSVPYYLIGTEVFLIEEAEKLVILDCKFDFICDHDLITDDQITTKKSIRSDHVTPQHLAELERRFREGYSI